MSSATSPGSGDLQAFRQEVRRTIRAKLPEDIRRKVAREQMEIGRDEQLRWHRILYECGGWSCPNWPKEHGGPGWSYDQQYIFERELALADAPRIMGFNVSMLGPTIMHFGTEEQKRRFLPPILKGEVFWCQGFSEPNAGSDLASLKCRADRDGAHYVINGTKFWTTEGHMADWMFGVFRTDSSGKKQHGITFLMFPMTTPGITVRPILTFDGTHEVNQVFFDDVRVPIADRLGEEHKGWTVAKYLLSLERIGTAEVSRSLASLGRLKRLAHDPSLAGTPLIDDPLFGQQLAMCEIELMALDLAEQRILFGAGDPGEAGAEASLLKLVGTEVQGRLLELTMRAIGAPAVFDGEVGQELASGALPVEIGRVAKTYFNMRKALIYSGSNEIQKNIIAKAVLGLG
jgi:alkylation response protein AidB-like acyl-CoA dehydrogenase